MCVSTLASAEKNQGQAPKVPPPLFALGSPVPSPVGVGAPQDLRSWRLLVQGRAKLGQGLLEDALGVLEDAVGRSEGGGLRVHTR